MSGDTGRRKRRQVDGVLSLTRDNMLGTNWSEWGGGVALYDPDFEEHIDRWGKDKRQIWCAVTPRAVPTVHPF